MFRSERISISVDVLKCMVCQDDFRKKRRTRTFDKRSCVMDIHAVGGSCIDAAQRLAGGKCSKQGDLSAALGNVLRNLVDHQRMRNLPLCQNYAHDGVPLNSRAAH
jgi:hypothetical protein